MKNADEILDFLNTGLGEDKLVWEGEHASIRFDDGIVVDFILIDTETVEMVHIVENLADVSDPDLCLRLLVANYQGSMTGQSRLSLTPDCKSVALCCRISVRSMNNVLFEEALVEFVNYAQFWESDIAADYLNDAESEKADNVAQYDEGSFFTRV